MKAADVPLARLLAQRLCGPPTTDAASAVKWMTCIQAQDFPGSRVSIALRTEDRSLAGVDEAMNEGLIVRSWPMRGTLHFVPAEDLGWMLSLTGPWMLNAAKKRREELDVTEAKIEKAKGLAEAALSDGKSISRDALIQLWDDAGMIERSEYKYHLIANLSQSGFLCFGPTKGGKQELVLLNDWVKSRTLSREEALGEWALRYMRSHGPASVKDFSWWTKLSAGDVKSAINSVRSQLHVEEVDGVELLMDPALPDLLNEHRKAAQGIDLLPGFDEFVLGYGARDHFLSAAHANKIVPGNNGMFLPTVVSKGQVVGTWKHKGTGAKRTFLPSPFEKDFPSAVTKAYARLPN